MKNVETEKYMGEGGLGFLLSLSFYLHPYRKSSDQINKNYGKDFFHQSISFRGQNFHDWKFVNDHWTSEFRLFQNPVLLKLIVEERLKILKSDSHLPKKNLFYLLQWQPFKKNKKCFLFHLKALFVLEIFKFLSWLLGHVEKTAWLKIYDFTVWLTKNYNTHNVQYLTN